jgi:outer membrane lipoprotein-sorting protein
VFYQLERNILLIRQLRKLCRITLRAAAFIALAAAATLAQNSSHWTTFEVLKQMNHSAGHFHSLSADLEQTKYTDVVKDTSLETGRIFVRRDEKMRIEFQKPDAKTILRSGNSLYIYTPKINRVEEYDLGKNRAMVDQYLLLGFGTKGEDVKKGYLLTVLGEETIDSHKTVLLELTPVSESMRRQISKIHMWIDEALWIPVQQKFFETGSGDYFIFHYKNIALNGKLRDSQFKPDWPKNATLVKPRA